MRMILMLNRTGRLLLLMVGTSVALAGCSGATGTQGAGRMTVVASIYTLQYVVEQVGGDLVAVSTVTPAVADPHAVALSPRQLRRFGEADAVVYLSGFQPAVDENGNQPSSGTLDPH